MESITQRKIRGVIQTDAAISAIKSQADTLIHMSGADFYNPLHIMLAEKLSAICPGPHTKKVFFGNSGAESVEAAFKLARYHTTHYCYCILQCLPWKNYGGTLPDQYKIKSTQTLSSPHP